MQKDDIQYTYSSNPYYDITNPIPDTKIKFLVDNEGRLYKIIWRTKTSCRKEKKQEWKLSAKTINKYNLVHAFKCLAHGNPEDFQKLYNTLKEHDQTIFPYIEKALE